MRRLVFALCISLVISPAFALSLIDNPQVEEFAARMEQQHGLPQQEVLASLHKARPKPSVLTIMQRAPETTVSWLEYRARFIDDQHIRDGRKFIRQHAAIFDRTQRIYQVPDEIITAIIGVESNYGRLKGGYRAIDALATLAFSDYRRSEFFRYQLEQLFLLANEQNEDPLSYRSSYAGAMGLGQFLPSSYRHYGVDFDQDGKVSLQHSIADSIGSIANYLSAYGWCPHLPVALPATFHQQPTELPPMMGFELKRTLAEWQREYGIVLVDDHRISNQEKALATQLIGEEPPLWLGFCPYRTLAKYNPSHYYVMALFLLSSKIAEQPLEEKL